MYNLTRFDNDGIELIINTDTGDVLATQGMLAKICNCNSTQIRISKVESDVTIPIKDSRGVMQLSKLYKEEEILRVFSKYKPELITPFINTVKKLTGKELSVPPIPSNKPKYYRSSKGYIYLFASEQVLKLGFSTNPEKRIKDLQRWNGELEIIHTIKGTESKEKQLHKLLHQTGEYFGCEWYPVYRKHEILNLMGFVNTSEKQIQEIA